MVIYKALGHHTVLIDIRLHSDTKNINLSCNVIWFLDNDKKSCLLEITFNYLRDLILFST